MTAQEAYDFVSANPGATSIQISRRFGKNIRATNDHLKQLTQKGYLERRGLGTSKKPYKYFPARSPSEPKDDKGMITEADLERMAKIDPVIADLVRQDLMRRRGHLVP